MRGGHHRRPRGAARRARSGAARGGEVRHDERGETLVELLVTVGIMGIAIVGILVSIANAIMMSSRLSDGSRANLALQEQAEWLKSEATTYTDCASGYTLKEGSSSLPPGWAVEIVQIRYWDGDVGDAEVGWIDDQVTCLTNSDQGMQQIVVEVRNTGPRPLTKQVMTVKRDRECPGNAPPEVDLC